MYNRKNLYTQLLRLEQDAITIAEDIKQLKKDFTCSEDNPDGLDKTEVAEVAAFAKKVVTDGVEKVIETGERFSELKSEFE